MGIRRLSKNSIIIITVAVVALFLGYYFGLSRYFSLARFQAQQETFAHAVRHNYWFSVGTYIALYIILLACALPIVAPLTLVGGYLFGMVPGCIYAMLGCLGGGLMSFVVLRYVVRRWIVQWYGTDRIEHFNRKLNKYGYSYLVMLQLLSIIPLFVISLLAALARVPLTAFLWSTALGSLPMVLIFSIAGTRLSTIRSVKEIFSPSVIIIFVLLLALTILPVIIRRFKRAPNLTSPEDE